MSRQMRWEWEYDILEKRDAYRVLVGKPEGKRPLGRLKCKWEGHNIKIELQKVGHSA